MRCLIILGYQRSQTVQQSQVESVGLLEELLLAIIKTKLGITETILEDERR